MSTFIPASNEPPFAATEGVLRSAGNEAAAAELTWVERGLLAVGVFEIPLQIDTYLMFHKADAALGAVGGINISVTTLCLMALYWTWMGSVVQRQSVAAKAKAVCFGVPMLVYLVAVVLSMFAAILPILSLFDLALLVQAYLLFFYVANRIRTKIDVWYIIATCAAALGFQSLLIFGLAAMGDSLVGTSTQLGPLNLMVWEDGRPCGSMQSAVLAGSVMALLWLPISSTLLATSPKWMKIVAAIATCTGLLAILLTQTRGAIMTSFLGSVLIGCFLLNRGWLPKWVITATLLMAIIGAWPLYQVILKRVAGDDTGSAEARIHLAVIASEMIQDHPLFGTGAGNCHLSGQRYADQAAYRSEWYYTIHNKFLLVWVETGLVGLIAFFAVLFNGIRQAWGTWRSRDRALAPIGIALVAAILGHMLHMTVDVFNSRTQVQILWVMLGLTAAVYRISRQTVASENSNEPTPLPAGSAGQPGRGSSHG